MNSQAKWSDYFALPNPGLEGYFKGVREGNDQEFRTTFAKGKSPEQVLKEWKPTLDKIKNDWHSLMDYEEDLAKKVGPLSIQKPLKERMDDIKAYYDLILLKSEPLEERAITAVVQEWGKLRGLQIRSESRTLDLMKKSTNSGSPFFIKRKAAMSKTVPCSISVLPPYVEQKLPFGTWKACAVLGWRGQEGGPTDEDVKQRVVWMFPMSVNIRELQFYQPAIEQAQKHNLVPAWKGSDAVDIAITKLFDTKAKSDLIVCTDFSKFDQHFNSDMQKAAESIIRQLLNTGSDSRCWLHEVFPVKYMIPLAIDTNSILFGNHGMGSGSGGTNFDETLVHRALQYEAAFAARSELNPYSMCLGDDGILTFPGIDIDVVTQTYCRHGQEMNVDKQYASALDCTYLRRWHHAEYRKNGVCVGVYSTNRAIGRLCEQERFYDPEVWGPEMVALRQLSIIENCKYHPLFHEFVEFCMKRDKYRLGLDIPGFLDNITKLAKESIDVMPDFLGYTKSLDNSDQGYGIAEWAVIKYLKSIA